MKTVLITGANSGFGLEMVKDFLAQGNTVIATLRKLEERKELFSNMPNNKNLHLLEVDVTIEEDRQKLKNEIEVKFNSKLDILINNAGYGSFGSLEDTSEQQIRYQMEVNYFAPALLIKALLPFMRDNRAKIINISSIMGRYSTPLASVYSSSKYALEGLSEGLRYELSQFGVQVCTITPGGHRTNFINSITWGENSLNSNSPYRNITQGLQNMMTKLQSRTKAPGPKNISQVALKLANQNSIPRTVSVGADAKTVDLIQKILPRKVYDALMSFGFKKVFGR